MVGATAEFAAGSVDWPVGSVGGAVLAGRALGAASAASDVSRFTAAIDGRRRAGVGFLVVVTGAIVPRPRGRKPARSVNGRERVDVDLLYGRIRRRLCWAERVTDVECGRPGCKSPHVGIFTNDKPKAGSLLGQAQVLGVQATGSQRQFGGGIPEQKVRFDLLVTLDNRPPFRAEADRFVPLTQLAQLGQGVSFIAVWADPERLEKVVVDLTIPPPTVTAAPGQGAGSAADILATGVRADAVIQQFSPLPMRNSAGHEMFAFSLTVMPPHYQPYMIQVGNAAPPEAFQYLFPGSRVPVRIGATQQDVVIDWQRALGS